MAQPDETNVSNHHRRLQRRWGTRAIYRPGDTQSPMARLPHRVQRRWTGGTGDRGLPRGRFSRLIGYGTAGQSTVAARTLAQAQSGGQQVAYVDVGATPDIDNLVRCGVRLDDLTILRRGVYPRPGHDG